MLLQVGESLEDIGFCSGLFDEDVFQVRIQTFHVKRPHSARVESYPLQILDEGGPELRRPYV